MIGRRGQLSKYGVTSGLRGGRSSATTRGMSQIAPMAPRQAIIAAEMVLPAPELSIVIPTYKEAGNIAPLVEKLETVLAGMAWEAIFVDDDSPDGTAEAAKSIAMTNPHVRCLRRVNRRGLAGACIEGILSSSAPFVAVMDADLQHDETL